MLGKMLNRLTLPVLLLLSSIAGSSIAQPQNKSSNADNGVLQKMLAAKGSIEMNLDLNRITNGGAKASQMSTLNFQVAANSFFTVLVYNDLLRGPEASSMGLVSPDASKLPAALHVEQLVMEKLGPEEGFDLAIRDGKTGFVFFNISGHEYGYDANTKSLRITNGRLQLSSEFAKKLGRTADAGAVVGSISVSARMIPIEVDHIVNGNVQSATMPTINQPDNGTNPGPDVIVGDLPSVEQGGSSGGFVGLGVGTTSCNAGVVNLDWFALPSNDHPAIPQNMYRMSGGADNTERFEQIGQGWCKHAFTALTQNVCGFGCNGTGGSHLGSGCSDPYDASLNYDQSRLGSRAWINPFTGVYPRGDSGATNPNNHSGHSHSGTSHRLLVAATDLASASNPGATYFAEGQYITPHEYLWCHGDGGSNPPHPGECNMYNNVSYRRFTPSGTTSFTFASVGATVRTQPAINAWTSATRNTFEPDPGNDGIGIVGYKVTNPSAGVWHYEYAVYNQNLDRAIQSFSVPLGCGVTVSNLGFHAPPQPAAFTNDGTQGNTGFSSTPWATNQTATAMTWSSETFAQNANANAIRWGTLYNFRFDSNKPPQAANATIGFFKTGSPITVAIQAPMPDACNALSVVSAVSRKTHGAAGDFDIGLPLSGEPGVECRTGGANGNHTIIVTFTNNIASGSASIIEGTGNIASAPINNNTMTVNLTAVDDVQKITVKLSNVTDTFSQVLPDTNVSMNVLLGDSTGNKSVNATDISLAKTKPGEVVDVTNFREDVTASGDINASDITAIKVHSGNSVP
jgi:hypothetical protein